MAFILLFEIGILVNSNPVIDVTTIPWQEHEKKILTAVLSGEPPDIISQFNPVAQWASRMALTPLNDFIEHDAFDSTVFFPALWQEMKWYGETFALPIKTASFAFFYNNELFRSAGLDPEKPPKTWDEVKEYSKKLTKYDQDGNLTQMGFIGEYSGLPNHGDMPTALLMAWQLGAQFLSKDGSRVRFTDPNVIRALQWVSDFDKEYDIKKLTTFIIFPTNTIPQLMSNVLISFFNKCHLKYSFILDIVKYTVYS